MKLGILAAGITPDELLAEFGSYAEMCAALLRSTGLEFDVAVFDVREGDFPDSLQQCDAWLVTGSKFSVYEDLAWIGRLKVLIREIHAARQPMIGICFGHQVIAEALGGKVEKYSGGWGVGLHQYRLEGGHAFISHSPAEFSLNAMHQDQVVSKPPEARVLASSDFCPYAGLVYGDSIISLQAHPEFTREFEDRLIRLRAGRPIPDAVAKAGLASLQDSGAVPDGDEIANWFATFLSQNYKN